MLDIKNVARAFHGQTKMRMPSLDIGVDGSRLCEAKLAFSLVEIRLAMPPLNIPQTL
jgi:hypothetical protein